MDREESSQFKLRYWITACVAFFIAWFFFLLTPPLSFQKNTEVTVPQNAPLGSIAKNLETAHIVRSKTVFEICVILLGGEKRINAGNYFFVENSPVYRVAYRLVRGGNKAGFIKITIPEGKTNTEMADILGKKLPHFDQTFFLQNTKNKEGYLFPDTYFFEPVADATKVISQLSDEFNQKIEKIHSDIESSDHSLAQIITMASILEGEANKSEDMKVVSGILWKRISIGMALQVDAAPETYAKRGLPNAPINNPGLVAIDAALHPDTSPYLFYLHDKNGMIHYAKTFEEHKSNKAKYL